MIRPRLRSSRASQSRSPARAQRRDRPVGLALAAPAAARRRGVQRSGTLRSARARARRSTARRQHRAAQRGAIVARACEQTAATRRRAKPARPVSRSVGGSDRGRGSSASRGSPSFASAKLSACSAATSASGADARGRSSQRSLGDRRRLGARCLDPVERRLGERERIPIDRGRHRPYVSAASRSVLRVVHRISPHRRASTRGPTVSPNLECRSAYAPDNSIDRAGAEAPGDRRPTSADEGVVLAIKVAAAREPVSAPTTARSCIRSCAEVAQPIGTLASTAAGAWSPTAGDAGAEIKDPEREQARRRISRSGV